MPRRRGESGQDDDSPVRSPRSPRDRRRREDGSPTLFWVAAAFALYGAFSVGQMHAVPEACPPSGDGPAAAAARAALAAATRRLDELERGVAPASVLCPPCPAGQAAAAPRCPPPKKCPHCKKDCKKHTDEVARLQHSLQTVWDTRKRTRREAEAHAHDHPTPLGNARVVDRRALWDAALSSLPYNDNRRGSSALLIGAASVDVNASLKEVTASCKEVDVVQTSDRKDVCVAIFDGGKPVSAVLRVDLTGGSRYVAQQKALYPKRYKPPAGTPAWTRTVPLASSIWPLPPMEHFQGPHRVALDQLGGFATQAPELVRKVDALIKERLEAKHGAVVVMTTNKGTLDMVANFVCSCRAARVPTTRVLVFAADAATAAAVEALGLAAFHDAGLGELPGEAAESYGDRTFVKMMWLKITSVYLVAATDRPVLFQDADVVWFRNPLEYFEAADPGVDAFFQDDGARSARYAPYYANSGFYYLRATRNVKYLLHRVLMTYDEVVVTRSHQQPLQGLLLDHAVRHGLALELLDDLEFPQGHVFHRKKDVMASFADGSRRPYLFHMCWTSSRKEKVSYLKNSALWFISPLQFMDAQCPLVPFWPDVSKHATAENGPKSAPGTCCLADARAWTVPTPYATKLDFSSKLD